MGSNTEQKPWINLKTYTKIEAKRLRVKTFSIAKFEERKLNGGKSNIAIAILEKLPF